MGRNEGQIILGHAISEEPGMEDCANWLRTFISEVPIGFVRPGGAVLESEGGIEGRRRPICSGEMGDGGTWGDCGE
jgi:hypothetical protein